MNSGRNRHKRVCPSYNGIMDTIIYLYIIKKEQGTAAGGESAIPPVFSIRKEEKEGYRILFTGIPELLLGCDKDARQEQKNPENPGEKRKSKQKRKWFLPFRKPQQEKFGSRPLPNYSLVQYPLQTCGMQGDKFQTKNASLFLWRQNHRLTSGRRGNQNEKTQWVSVLLSYLKPYRSEYPDCYYVCEDTVDKWLKKEELCEWWQQHWTIFSFDDYRQRCFAEELLQKVPLVHYLILGYEDYIPELLKKWARHMKSLRFILSRTSEELDIFLEDFYEESGLTASIQIVSGKAGRQDAPYYGYNVVCPNSSVILDFSGEAHLFTADVARGSLWLDMDSLEEKRRRIEDRNTGIQYLSMKKEWKKAART